MEVHYIGLGLWTLQCLSISRTITRGIWLKWDRVDMVLQFWIRTNVHLFSPSYQDLSVSSLWQENVHMHEILDTTWEHIFLCAFKYIAFSFMQIMNGLFEYHTIMNELFEYSTIMNYDDEKVEKLHWEQDIKRAYNAKVSRYTIMTSTLMYKRKATHQ